MQTKGYLGCKICVAEKYATLSSNFDTSLSARGRDILCIWRLYNAVDARAYVYRILLFTGYMEGYVACSMGEWGANIIYLKECREYTSVGFYAQRR